MGVAIILLIFVYPVFGRFNSAPWFKFIYLFLSMSILYLIFIMVMYTLTSWLNLINIHIKKLNYVVVLGAGLIGKKVTPLLASRIDRGIEIYHKNPGSKLIMSGGQGTDEEIPESHAMAAKTKWYFTLNAFIREFIAYLVITKKMQLSIIGLFAFINTALAIMYYIFTNMMSY